MRQWYGVAPTALCRAHLLGEHVEQHMAAASLAKGKRLGKLFDEGWIDPGRVRERHDLCAKEMVARGYRHNSPLEYTDPAPSNNQDAARHRRELTGRCEECRKNLDAASWL